MTRSARVDRTVSGKDLNRFAAERATLARLAAHERWAHVRDRSAATAAARAAVSDRFLAEARRLHPGLPEDEILRRACNLRSAHAIRAAHAIGAARARWRGESRDASNATPTGKMPAQGSRRPDATTASPATAAPGPA